MSSIKDFDVLTTLGSGSFASVYKVKRISDGKEYAMKKVKLPSLSSKEKQNALNEVRILASINNPNIVGYKEAFYDDASQALCIIMEYASGGDLLKRISDNKKKNTHILEETIWSYFIQMLQGLKTLHDMKILHRDLKCANIFLGADGKTIKLGDLNVSKIAQQGLVYTQAGTPYYASPEVWQGKPYGVKSDIWSLGCILYELCTFLPPFRASDMEGLYKRILKGNYDKIPTTYSPELSKIIGLCLNVNPSMRPTCDGLLTHPSVVARMVNLELNSFKSKAPAFEDLLDTIRMPRNLKKLSEILPKPNYKPKEVTSLVDIDSKLDEDLKKKINQRPLSRLARAGSHNYPSNNIIMRRGDKKDVVEESLEHIIDSLESINLINQKKHPSLPPLDRLKAVEKMKPIQRAAKIVLMDINRARIDVDRVPVQLEKTLTEEGKLLPVIVKPSSRGGNRKISYSKEEVESLVHRRSITPIVRSRKGLNDILSEESEKIIRKEQKNIYNIEGRGPVKPIY